MRPFTSLTYKIIEKKLTVTAGRTSISDFISDAKSLFSEWSIHFLGAVGHPLLPSVRGWLDGVEVNYISDQIKKLIIEPIRSKH